MGAKTLIKPSIFATSLKNLSTQKTIQGRSLSRTKDLTPTSSSNLSDYNPETDLLPFDDDPSLTSPEKTWPCGYIIDKCMAECAAKPYPRKCFDADEREHREKDWFSSDCRTRPSVEIRYRYDELC